MAEIVVSEFMEDDAVADLAAAHDTLYDPALVDDPDRLLAAVGAARALIVRNRTQVRGKLLEAAERLTIVGRLGVGLDNIDLDACKARGIAVQPASGANDVSVAEYVITAALVLLRGSWSATPDVAAGRWPRTALMGGREIAGKTMGLIGFGSIAREVAERAAALGMRVLAHDPFLPADDPAWARAAPAALPDLLAASDVVSLHTPLTDGTRHLVDAAAIGRMKPDAILINAARGGVVDEAAVATALKAERLGGAALDVFETEPLTDEAAGIFADAPNLLLTPHIAGLSAESNTRVSAMIARAVLDHLAGSGGI